MKKILLFSVLSFVGFLSFGQLAKVVEIEAFDNDNDNDTAYISNDTIYWKIIRNPCSFKSLSIVFDQENAYSIPTKDYNYPLDYIAKGFQIMDTLFKDNGVYDVRDSLNRVVVKINFSITPSALNSNVKLLGRAKSPNIPFFIYQGLTIKTDKGDVTVTDQFGIFSFNLDPENLPSKVFVADQEYYSDSQFVFQSLYSKVCGDFVNLVTYLTQNKDLTVHLNSTRNRPGFTMPYTVSVENRGKTALKANVQVSLDSSLTYTSLDGENAPASVNGQMLQWDSVEVASGKSVILKFYATLDANTSLLGTNLQNTANLKMSVVDDVLANNTIKYTPIVTGSYDPNDKMASPQGAFTQGYVYDTTAFEYTIRFQNTGNDTAFTVRVTDVIDKDLDLTSINMIDASHKFVMSIKGDTVTWTFNNILLVDSTANEPASHGFVRFFIKQKKNNPQGTKITNLANIYFDFNAPIITNETVNIVDNFIVTGLEEENAKAKGTLNIYPNPVTSELYIQLSEKGNFVLYNQLGEKVYENNVLEKINLAHLSEGVYIYQVQTSGANYSGKILKK